MEIELDDLQFFVISFQVMGTAQGSDFSLIHGIKILVNWIWQTKNNFKTYLIQNSKDKKFKQKKKTFKENEKKFSTQN